MLDWILSLNNNNKKNGGSAACCCKSQTHEADAGPKGKRFIWGPLDVGERHTLVSQPISRFCPAPSPAVLGQTTTEAGVRSPCSNFKCSPLEPTGGCRVLAAPSNPGSIARSCCRLPRAPSWSLRAEPAELAQPAQPQAAWLPGPGRHVPPGRTVCERTCLRISSKCGGGGRRERAASRRPRAMWP